MATMPLASSVQAPPGQGDGSVFITAAFLGGAIVAWAVQGGTPAHLELGVCLLTSLAWMLLPIDATLVGLLGALGVATVATLTSTDSSLVAPLIHLGDDTTVLIIAAFVIAKAVETSGLARLLTDRIIGRQEGFIGYLRIGAGVFGSTFLIPSTAARASVVLPFVSGGRQRMRSTGEQRALMLMAPLVIVLGAFASPVAAAANLLAIQILAAQTQLELSFAMWIAVAAPLALVMSALAIVVPWFLLRSDRTDLRDAPSDATAPEAADVDRAAAWRAGLLVVAVVVLWATASWHGIEPMLVAVLGAVLVTLPRLGVLSLSQALKGVDWSLILLLATAAHIGAAVRDNAVVAEGVARAAAMVGAVQGHFVGFAVLAAMTLIAMLAHLAVSSRSARAALLLPSCIVVATAAGLDPVIAVLAVTAGAGFCILTPVGSKALLIFAGGNTALLRHDLVRVGLVLLPLQLCLTLLCALALWAPMLGGW